MTLVVLALTSSGLFLAQRKVAIEAERDLLQDFQNELTALHAARAMRHAALAERCRDLVQRPRIHAALEDNALDLLYPSARDELRDLVEREGALLSTTPAEQLHATFYRFLDGAGAVIPPPNPAEVGELTPEEEAQLRLQGVSADQQVGYVSRKGASGARATIDEVFAVPIASTESGDVIAMLALGFRTAKFGSDNGTIETKSAIWVGGRLTSPALNEREQLAVGAQVEKAVASSGQSQRVLAVEVDGASHLVVYQQLNPNSLFPPAYEVAIYPLARALARQRQIRNHVLLAGALLLLAGSLASYFLSRRFSKPVEELAIVSEENRAHRRRAEAALETTSEELQRSARFSADASHQLKTPVTLLRAGIDELLAHENFTPDVYDKLSALLHQTYRITSVIDDLLLLSRMDAGRLQINFGTVDLSRLLEEWIDDLSALPDDLHVKVKTDFPSDLRIAGERSYIALIVQNLLENARKYNIPGGSIRVSAREEGDFVILCIENTGRPIPLAAREHIFERFHRGGRGENIPGQGLGLNLARELARLHGGDVRLGRSTEECTEFEVRFRVAKATSPVLASSS